jgi:hypothetical protein
VPFAPFHDLAWLATWLLGLAALGMGCASTAMDPGLRADAIVI